MKKHTNFYPLKTVLLWLVISFPFGLIAQIPAKLTLHLDQSKTKVSPQLYGLMTEEINYSYDGGLYAELIRNRIFKDNFREPEHWNVINQSDGKATISLDRQQPINTALTTCLKLNVEKPGTRTGISNDGFWGIPIKPNTVYSGSFYAKADHLQTKPFTVSIESTDGKTTYASAKISGVNNSWKQYTFSLKTNQNIKPTADTRFTITTADTGNTWFNLVSLFPPTYNNRPNGNRADIMQLLSDMKPAFLRLPGGNYLEGQIFSTRYDWKKTLGPLDQRPGHMGTWGYRSSDGMGLLEYLNWCEDLKMNTVLALFAGYTLNKDYLEAGPMLKPFVDDALDELEYVMGDKNTKWGAKRAQNGHPQPFKLTYVEIGNEDGFDLSGSYE
ncbi:MAG: alpha-N-arabinofuranosidase, partial [Sphingobacteriaceae bacterium]